MKKILLLLSLTAVFMACGRLSNSDEKGDQESRIVCIAKQYSEIIYALGAEKDIVAVDVSSTYPPEIKKLPTVGYHRALSTEGILAAKPTLILHDNNIGPEHVVKQLEELKIPMKVFANKGSDIDSTKMLIREMGEYFQKQARAEELCQKLDADMSKALESVKQYPDSVKVLVVHFGQANNVFLLMTQKSTAAQLLRWAGGKVAVDDARGMKQFSAEAVAASDPDVILLTDFGYDRLGTLDKIKELPGIAGTKAAKNNRIYRVEEHDMVYLGPRSGKVVSMLQKLIHEGTQP